MLRNGKSKKQFFLAQAKTPPQVKISCLLREHTPNEIFIKMKPTAIQKSSTKIKKSKNNKIRI